MSLDSVSVAALAGEKAVFSTALDLHKNGLFEDAEIAYQKLIAANPDSVPVLHNLAALMVQRGRHEEALSVLAKALEFSPKSENIHATRGAAYMGLGRYEEAIGDFTDAIRLKPDHADGHCNAGLAAQRLQRHGKAKRHFQKALKIQPRHTNSLIYLGLSHIELGELTKAIVSFNRALKVLPDSVLTLTSKGVALRKKGNLAEALVCFNRALEIAPQNTNARINRATLNLLLGNFKQGWSDFEARTELTGWHSALSLDMATAWNGENLCDKTILLCTEQGTGDNIQCLRYVTQLKAMGGRVVVAAPPNLACLFEQMDGVDEVISTTRIPDFDYWCPLFSLPGLLGEDLTQAHAPYLHMGAVPASTGRRVGLVWAGDPKHLDDSRRSVPFTDLLPLFEKSGITFCGLQLGERANDPTEHSLNNFEDLSAGLADYSATARAIADLDLVISVDTSVAHLAGAMGKPVWLMLPYAPDWRWGLESNKTAWYPDMEVFRQTRPGNWTGLISEIAKKLD